MMKIPVSKYSIIWRFLFYPNYDVYFGDFERPPVSTVDIFVVCEWQVNMIISENTTTQICFS